jgi:hypothetical protein
MDWYKGTRCFLAAIIWNNSMHEFKSKYDASPTTKPQCKALPGGAVFYGETRRFLTMAARAPFVLLVFAGFALGQIALEENLYTAQDRLLLLQRESLALAAAGDSLAQQIRLLKGEEPLNFFERRRLDKALRDAQDLAVSREVNLRALTEQRGEEVRFARALDERYAAVIDSLLKAADRIAPAQRHELSAQAERLRSRRAALQSLLMGDLPASSPAPAIALKSGDLPDEIRAKADLLRDREDQLRRQVLQLERRTGQVKQETSLRKKMADLVADVSLFEQRDETAQLASRSVAAEATNDFGGKAGVEISRESLVSMDLASPADQLLRVDLRSLSAEDADQLLRDLEGQRRRLILRADSLAIQARQFDAEADKLRDTLKQNR